MNTRKHLLPALVTSILANASLGYEIDTHANLTWRSFEKSGLASNSPVVRSLGLFLSQKPTPLQEEDGTFAGRFKADPTLGDSYFDMSTQPPTRRFVWPYDHYNGFHPLARDIPGANGGNYFRWPKIETHDGVTAPFIRDWLARGSVREDDDSKGTVGYASGLCAPTFSMKSLF